VVTTHREAVATRYRWVAIRWWREPTAQDKLDTKEGTMSNVPVAPPAAVVPHVPDGFMAPKEPVPGPSPTIQQVRDAADVAAELKNPEYQSHFSKEVAPDQDAFTTELLTAKAWSDEVEATKAWLEYAKVQRDLAWLNVFTTLRRFRPIFEAVMEAKPALVKVYKQTRAFFDVWKVAAEKAVATKAENKKAAKKPEPK
jgi:hypothetical protein